MPVEMKRGAAGAAPHVKDLTADELAYIDQGGKIECEVVGGRWVKRRVGPSASKLAHPRRRVALAPNMAQLKRKLMELVG